MYEYKYVDFNHTMGVVQAKMDDYQAIIHEEAKRLASGSNFCD